MNRSDFCAAVSAAELFLEQAKRVKWQSGQGTYCEAGRETAALKRRSMDLTRALADLRHPYRNQAK